MNPNRDPVSVGDPDGEKGPRAEPPDDLFEALFRLSPDAVAVGRASDGRFIEVNERFSELFGHARDEAIGRTSTELGMWGDPKERDRFFEAIRASGEVRMFVKAFHKSGRAIDLALSGRLGLVRGEPCIISMGRDETELRGKERALREAMENAHERLERHVAERTAELRAALEELETFSYSVSHDLRAPLRAIDGFSRAVLEDCGDRIGEDGRDYLRRIRAASQRLDELIDNLLELSRASRSELERQDVDLSTLAADVVANLRRAEPERAVDVEIEAGLRCHADGHLVRAVLENLLGNAWKYTAQSPAPKITLRAARGDGPVHYVVEDNGAGFDMTYADKLFRPFQRLHSAKEFKGNGVGLATAHRIVRRHGGFIRAHGEVGRGARFEFSLEPGCGVGDDGTGI